MIKLYQNKTVTLIFNSCIFIVLGWLAYGAFYELFIFEPGIHYPRINVCGINNDCENSDPILNIPTICSLIILISSIISLFSSFMIFIITTFRFANKTRIFWIIQLTGISVGIICLFIETLDFLGCAFRGVG